MNISLRRHLFLLILILILIFCATQGHPASESTDWETGIWYHAITVFSILVFKVATLVVGYLLARLGYDLLIKGVTGEFKFHTEVKGTKADLISASPGLFFILMATIIIGIGIFKTTPFETHLGIRPKAIKEAVEKSGLELRTFSDKPALREKPPTEVKK